MERPLLAQSGQSRACPLLAAERTCRTGVLKSPFDHCRHWLRRWVRPKIYSLADLLGGLMSTVNAATICIAAAKANGTT
jgi:hypothetical protein